MISFKGVSNGDQKIILNHFNTYVKKLKSEFRSGEKNIPNIDKIDKKYL